jgi:hypothetical protein
MSKTERNWPVSMNYRLTEEDSAAVEEQGVQPGAAEVVVLTCPPCTVIVLRQKCFGGAKNLDRCLQCARL